MKSRSQQRGGDGFLAREPGMGWRLGILGGTFDPPHYGHLRSAEEVRERLGLSRVLFVVASIPPHKNRVETPFVDRCELTRRAVDDVPYFEVSDVEYERPGKSYSVETLRVFRHRYPEWELFFIIGADSFFEITSWKSYRMLPRLASLVVLNRPGFPSNRFPPFLKKTFPGFEPAATANVFCHSELNPVYFLDTTLLDISSTGIRNLVRQGKSIRFLVPETVRKTILEKGLYRE